MDHKQDENKIKKILSEMPDIKDSRSKETIYSRLKEDERLKSLPTNMPSRKKRSKWIPAVVTVAALLVLSILIPSMLNSNYDNDKADEMAIMANDKREMSNASGVEVSEDNKANSVNPNLDIASKKTELEVETFNASDDIGEVIYGYAVYPQDVGNNTLFHIGLAGDAAASVPVTFLIPNSQIEQDFGDVKPTSFDLYEKYAAQIDEEALGFPDYHPYKGSLSVVGNSIIHTLPAGHGYDTASGTMDTYIGTLQDTFFGFEELIFQNEDGTVLEFDQVGEPSEPLQLRSGKNHFNYYLFKQEDGQEYLSSNFRETYDTIEIALNEMKKTSNDIYSSIIPENINFQIVDAKEVAIVKFINPLDLQSMNEKEAIQMIDGMLLTAASFGKQLQFENVIQEKWNGMDFREPLPIPVGPNLLPFLLK